MVSGCTTNVAMPGYGATMRFSNPTFNDDINVTVRRGIKWAHTKGSAIALVNKEEAIPICITASKIVRFTDISTEDLALEHDPSCRDFAGLLETMKKLYSRFDEMELVTVVYFVVIR